MTPDVYINDVSKAVIALGGRKAIAEYLPYGPNAVSNAVRRGRLPSDWWFALKPLADSHGVLLSPDIFTFIPAIAAPALNDPLFRNGTTVGQTGAHPQEMPPVFDGRAERAGPRLTGEQRTPEA